MEQLIESNGRPMESPFQSLSFIRWSGDEWAKEARNSTMSVVQFNLRPIRAKTGNWHQSGQNQFVWSPKKNSQYNYIVNPLQMDRHLTLFSDYAWFAAL